jgi:O-antigen biosynthesis protein WbqP
MRTAAKLRRERAAAVGQITGHGAHPRGALRIVAERRGDGVADLQLKRAFDIAASALAIIVLSPLMVIISLLVIGTSAGPALHMSPRIGRYGRVFTMPKFRTMVLGSPTCARETLRCSEGQLTPIGKFLRRTGLDELPQLACVLSGEMSFIGPRPLLADDPGLNERAKFPRAFSVRPGISGLAQVSGRNLLSPRRKARLDALYARTASFGLDMVLLARTLVVVVSGKGFL